jgi:hypothetical protein
MNPAQYLIIKYDDLVQDPQGTVRNIYDHFGYEMSTHFEKEVGKIVRQASNFRSRHKYDLEEMGISREKVLSEFVEIFDRFGFDKGLDGVSPAGKESTLN